MSRRIVARPLTAEAFAPFGEVLQAAGMPDRPVNLEERWFAEPWIVLSGEG